MTSSSKSSQLLYAKKHNFSGLLTMVSLGLVIAGTIGLVLLRKPLTEQSQDLRQDASVANGKVVVTATPSYGTSFTVNQPIVLEFKVNTNGVQTDGIQLTYYIEGEGLSSPIVEILTNSGLVFTTKQVQATDNGFKVNILALPDFGQPFSTINATTFARATFSSTQVGSFSIDFDERDSIAAVYESDPARDELNNIASGTYQVVAAAASPSPSPSPTPTPNATPDPTPTPTPTPTPGTGGTTTKQCNEGCSNSTECGANNFCYYGKCRLVTNPQSTSCVNPPDQGLSFSCNEYCSNTGECAGGYSCLNNRCRRADNPDDTLCRLPSNKTQQKVIASCNKSCTSNSSCAVNLRCYQGSCRLAVNPTSSSCSAAAVTPKGGEEDDQDPSDKATSSSSGSTTTTNVSPRPTATPKAAGSGSTGTTEEVVVKEEGNLLTTVRNLLPLRLIAVIAIGLGALILALLLIPRLLGRRRSSGSGPVTATKPTQTSNTEYEKELQAKLNALKQQQSAPVITASTAAPLMAPPSAMTARPPAPMVPAEPRPVIAVPPMQSPVIQDRTMPVQPIAAAPITEQSTEAAPETPVFNRSSSMMDRIREKGINPPASDATSDQS